MNRKRSLGLVLVAGFLVGGCASPGTKVTTSNAAYRDMTHSQQAWCSTFSSSCGCTIDGDRATCSLAYACLNSGNCKVAQ